MSKLKRGKTTIKNAEQYVSRAGLKLASIAKGLGLNFKDCIVLDVGSSTGGFTDYALQHGAKKVIAVDAGTDQLHSSLRDDKRIELHEKTDIRDFKMNQKPDVILVDVSFISLRNIMPHLRTLMSGQTLLVAMCKPQFEADRTQLNKGIVKNGAIRREILKNFEDYAKQKFVVLAKADSGVAGANGNIERFYLLKKNRSATA